MSDFKMPEIVGLGLLKEAQQRVPGYAFIERLFQLGILEISVEKAILKWVKNESEKIQ